MSTKNLARTVIEGGRSRWCKSNRRNQTATYRAREREALHDFMTATEIEAVVAPRPASPYRDFADKLGPASRWLQRQAGRPWNAVRSELFQRFDARTVPGRHIIFCHMLPWVEEASWFSHRRLRFEIDRHGILRCLCRVRKTKRKPNEATK